MSECGPLDFARLRKSAEFAEEQARIADAGPLPVVPVHWAEHYAKDVRRLCDALEEAERAMRRTREALEPRAGYWSDEEASAVAILDEALACSAGGESEEGKP